MRRRVLLQRVGTGFGAVTIAGAVATAAAADADLEFHCDAPRSAAGIDDAAIETTHRTCATDAAPDLASVSIDDDRLELTGNVETPNPCHEAVLSAVELDEDGETLSVTVDAERDAVDLCQACLGRIEYAATIAFEDEVPEILTLIHAAIAAEAVVEEEPIEAIVEAVATEDGAATDYPMPRV